ncbi:MAG: ABC transporter ATP-binding protein [Chloroflexi bacterium]|nr:ABC transporter ATP-binding protein [Chloroflexota bacterium]MDA1228079.1 ABC transporter ATP-binding protein [Chloroflexota bacterium]
MKLRVQDVSWNADGRSIIRDIGLHALDKEFIGVVGPNGSGKSTLLRCIYRALKPAAGLISLDGEDIRQITAKEAARRTAVVLQEATSDFDFTTEEIVAMGRTPHKGLFQRDTAMDLEIIAEALARVGMEGFAEREFNTLSGGEKQRVLIARALAQQTKFLVLDEPTNHLDIRYQLEILDLVKGLGVTTIAAVHDLNLAAAYCDRIYVVQAGEIVESGCPADVLRPELIKRVFGVGSMVDANPLTGTPRITFFGSGVRAVTESSHVPVTAQIGSIES